MEKLTKKEEEVMGFFWKKGALFVRQLRGFYKEPKPHFNTLSTFVRGLEAKGFLSHHAFGERLFQYYPVISEQEFRNGTLKNVINKYFNNSCLDMVSTLVEEEDISLDELKELIKRVEDMND